MIFSFSHPQYLFLLFSIPIFFLIHFFSLSNRKKIALRFANFDAISKVEGVDFFSKNIFILFLSLVIVLSMILAISGLTFHTFKESTSFSFVIAIDHSQSMQADDFFPDRLTASKQVAKNFIDIIPYETNIGIVSFSGSSYIRQDMSQDKSGTKNAIDEIELSQFGGTNIYEAVITSTNLLRNQENKTIILLSDGQINIGTIEDITYYANRNDVIIHTIAIGTKEGGTTEYTISKLDEETLKSVSEITGGNYFVAENSEALAESFEKILKLTKKKVSIELFNYLIIISIILFILKFFLTNTRYFPLP